MTHDPTTPPWKQTHHRQTDRGQGEELASQFSPLCHLKRNSNRLHSTQPPHPTHSSVCGTTLLRKVSPRQLPITLPSLWFAPGNSVPSSFLQPPAQSPRHLVTYSDLLSFLGLPAPGLLGEQHPRRPPSSQQGPRQALCTGCGTHTAAPLSLRSGADRCRLIRGGVVYGG